MAPQGHAIPGDSGERAERHMVRRGVGAAGLLGIALIHVLDLQGKLDETPYLGVVYVGVILASVALAESLIRTDHLWAWLATAALSAAVLLGYVVNRTVGMPGATEDIGNWLEPLGLASLFVEGCVVLVAVPALLDLRGAARR